MAVCEMVLWWWSAVTVSSELVLLLFDNSPLKQKDGTQRMSKLFTEAVPKILDTIFSQMHVHFVTRHPEHILLSHGLD